ncbi:MAG: hypothetical protein NTX45_22940 [Proteobacteria bacterium]|nr:hypothetical protein [Pseudomonadota bacterium]
MIPPQDAVSRAKKYLLELDPQDNITDLRLEEVEFIESEKLWSITLGFFRPHQSTTKSDLVNSLKSKKSIGRFFDQEKAEDLGFVNRIYKRLTIDAESGDFKAMKIREVN